MPFTLPPSTSTQKEPEAKADTNSVYALANSTLQHLELAQRQRQDFVAPTGCETSNQPKASSISPAMLAAVNFTSQLINVPMSIQAF